MTPPDTSTPAVEELIERLRNYWPSGSTEALLAVPKKAADMLAAFRAERDALAAKLQVAEEALCSIIAETDVSEPGTTKAGAALMKIVEIAVRTLSRLTAEPTNVEPRFDLVAHLERQRAFSLKTFGPGARTKGVTDHIAKELDEIRADPSDISEWVDVIILGFDGAWRAGWEPKDIVAAIVAKQTKNEARVWPDWRTADPDKAIEHDRTKDAPTPDAQAAEIERLTRERDEARDDVQKLFDAMDETASARLLAQTQREADSLSAMIIEWVDGGVALGTDWKHGLSNVIKIRLDRLRKTK
jgi:hypothetical protein